MARDLDVAGLGVGQRAVRPRRDDRREAGLLGAVVAHGVLEVEGDLALGPPGQPALEHRPQRVVGQRRGGANAVELSGLLDLAQALHDSARGHQLDAFQRLAQPAVVAHRSVRIVEAEPQRT
jgi:hypothetical protein